MSTRPILDDESASPEARALFDDIRAKRNTEYVNHFWRVMAHDPERAAELWQKLQRVMAPGELAPFGQRNDLCRSLSEQRLQLLCP